MAFFFTCGTHMFNSLLKGYESITAQCQNCGNFSAKVYKRWHWFTLCFVPVIPFSLKPDHDVGCHICNFYQDVKFRPDVQEMMNSIDQGNGTAPPHGQVQPGGQQGQIPMQPYGQQQQQQQPQQSKPTKNAPPQYI